MLLLNQFFLTEFEQVTAVSIVQPRPAGILSESLSNLSLILAPGKFKLSMFAPNDMIVAVPSSIMSKPTIPRTRGSGVYIRHVIKKKN